LAGKQQRALHHVRCVYSRGQAGVHAGFDQPAQPLTRNKLVDGGAIAAPNSVDQILRILGV
jgi:hypothetical protein